MNSCAGLLPRNCHRTGYDSPGRGGTRDGTTLKKFRLNGPGKDCGVPAGMACIGFQDRCEYAAVSASKRSRAN